MSNHAGIPIQIPLHKVVSHRLPSTLLSFTMRATRVATTFDGFRGQSKSVSGSNDRAMPAQRVAARAGYNAQYPSGNSIHSATGSDQPMPALPLPGAVDARSGVDPLGVRSSRPRTFQATLDLPVERSLHRLGRNSGLGWRNREHFPETRGGGRSHNHWAASPPA